MIPPAGWVHAICVPGQRKPAQEFGTVRPGRRSDTDKRYRDISSRKGTERRKDRLTGIGNCTFQERQINEKSALFLLPGITQGGGDDSHFGFSAGGGILIGELNPLGFRLYPLFHHVFRDERPENYWTINSGIVWAF